MRDELHWAHRRVDQKFFSVLTRHVQGAHACRGYFQILARDAAFLAQIQRMTVELSLNLRSFSIPSRSSCLILAYERNCVTLGAGTAGTADAVNIVLRA